MANPTLWTAEHNRNAAAVNALAPPSRGARSIG